ncbi:hypothetical protein EI77_00599 [Prosthecobacter fusiformis]|uniref:PepSY domain-containing protein n=1 Tax=Prosthecobacter fusiformis TaxID=48464 RepID=A0A4R7SS37_9BACT|nr:PepSY domain-containing protein [Prosthecobacter fusiformis]TDU81296.1 hypothetical protein EI77_00599 [Prosthecobacter fusiformis]
MNTAFIREIRAGLLALAIAACVLCLSPAHAGDDVKMENLPPAIPLAILDRFPDALFVKAEAETDDGKVKYEVEIKTQGKTLEVEILADGRILKVDD